MNKLLESIGGTSTDVHAARLEALAALEDTSIQPPESPPVEEAAYDTSQVLELSRTNLDFFAALTMPLVFKYNFPPVFISVWLWLLSYVAKTRDFSQLALGLPRGFGKTALIKLFVLFCILFTNRKFILILAENQTKANNILSDVIDMLEEENVKRVFGSWRVGIETDRQDLKKFGYRGRDIILMAGTVEVVRGVSLKNERPDIMIFDDIQSRSMAESQTVSEALEREMVGTAMKAKSPHGCLFIFVGNMYPTKWSILRHLKTNPNWIKFIAGGILADGTSLWEELQPIEQLVKEFQNDLSMGRPEIFFSEVLNDEHASANNLVDFSKLPEYKIPADAIPSCKYVVIDPSKGAVNSDDCAIGYFEGHEHNNSIVPVLKGLKAGKFSPMDTIKHALHFCLTHNCRLVVIEGVAYQATLAYWFNFVCQQMGIIGIEAVEIYPGGYSKNHRILSMFKQYTAGDILVHPDIRPEVHLEITQFNPMKTNNVDNILDLLTYAPKVIEVFGDFMLSMGEILDQEFSAIKVVENNSPF